MAATNIDDAILQNRSLAKKAKKAGQLKNYWECCLQESDLLLNSGKNDSSILILKNIQPECIAAGDTINQIKILSGLANCTQKSYDFKKTIDYLIEAQRLLNHHTPTELQFEVYRLLGNIHRQMKDYKSALRHYNYIETNFGNHLNQQQQYSLNLGIGSVYFDLAEYAKAEPYYLQANNLNESFSDFEKRPEAAHNLGLIYLRLRDYPQALAFTTISLRLAEKQSDAYQVIECYRALGGVYYLQSNFKEAEAYYLKALQISKEIKQPNSIIGNYRNLYLNSYFWGLKTNRADLFEKAYSYEKTWNSMRDSLYQSDLAEQLLELEKKYETEKKNAQIELLSKDNLIKEEELVIEQQQRRFMVVLILALFVVILVVSYFFWYYRKISRTLRTQSQLILEQKEHIARQNDELQKAIDTRDKLFSIIAHDLRSPLVSISNFVQLVNFYLRDNKLDSIQQLATDMGRKNAQVLQLTDNLLNWAQTQSGALQPKTEQINLKQILDECYELYQHIALDKQIELTIPGESAYQVIADRNMIRTICRNLINNALKFTPRKGRVEVSCYLDGQMVWVKVTDSGIGIASEKINRLFSPNKSDVLPGTEGEKSSGLGLLLCKEFVDIMNGQLRVESEVGKGSSFSFSVPVGNR
ncbi:MAG: ATP-binding protein [Mangrovibacterium sp.]